MNECKYAEKTTVGKQYVKCSLDGSIRKDSCHCKKYKPSLKKKIKDFFKCRY